MGDDHRAPPGEAATDNVAHFDWSSDTPTTAVVDTVSRLANIDPAELDPLYYQVDTDALDELFEGNGTVSGGVLVTLRWAGYNVTVSGDGTVEARPVDLNRTENR